MIIGVSYYWIIGLLEYWSAVRENVCYGVRLSDCRGAVGYIVIKSVGNSADRVVDVYAIRYSENFLRKAKVLL